MMDLVINPMPRLTSSLSPPAICSGSKFNYNPTSQATGTTFTWSRAKVTGITEAAGTNVGNPNETLTNETADPINVTYVYTLKTSNCTNPATFEVVVTVNPTPILSSALTAPAICNGSTFSYTPTSLTTGTIFEWRRLPNVGIKEPITTGPGNPNEVLTNLTETPVNVTYRYTLTANNCTNTTNNDVIVTVNPTPLLSSTLTPPAICSGTVFSYTPTSNTQGTNFAWDYALPIGINGRVVTGPGYLNVMLINETDNPIDVTFNFVLSANGCLNPVPYKVVVTVNPKSRLTSTLTPLAISNGEVFSYLPASLTAGTTFEWSRATMPEIDPPGSSGPGNPNEKLTNKTSAPVNVTYVYTLTANNCTNPTTYNVVVTVNPTPLLSSSLTPPAICSGTAFSYTPTSLTTGTIFEWNRAKVTGITPDSNKGFDNPNEVLTNSTSAPIDVTYDYTLSANYYTNPSTFKVVVTVNPTPQLLSRLDPPAICSGTAFSYLPTSATTGTTFEWYRKTVPGISPVGIKGPGNPNEILTNLTSDPIDVTYEYTLTANNCTNATTFNVVVTVNPTPLLSSTLTPPAICSGTAFSYVPTSSTVGTSFRWFRRDINGINPAGKTGLGNPNEVLTNLTSAPIDVTYEYTLTANNCTNATTFNVVVTVNPTPLLSSTLTPPAICSGTAFSYIPTSLTIGTSFAWHRQQITGIDEIEKSGFDNPNEVLTNTTQAPIDVTYEYTLTANNCPNATKYNVVVTVNPTPLLTSTLKPPAICSGSIFSYTPTSNTVGTTFGLSRNPVLGILEGGKAGSGNPNEILTNTTSYPIDVTYEYTLTANNCTNAAKYNVVVTVNPTPLLTSTLTPPAICSGSTVSYTPTSNTVGTTFVWNRSTIGGIQPAGKTDSGNPNEVLTNTTPYPIDVTYEYTLTANNCTNATKYNVVVTVNPTPLLSSTSTPPAICSGSKFNYVPTSLTVGTTFEWGRGTKNGIQEKGAAGFGDPNEVLTNLTADTIHVIYNYILTANNCTNLDTFKVNVTVNPRALLTSSMSPTAICSGTVFSYIPTSTTTGTTFEWSRGSMDQIDEVGRPGLGSINEVLTNNTAIPVNVTYGYTLKAYGCTNPTTFNVIVTVNPTPQLTSTLTPPAICSGTTFTYLPTSGTSGTSFVWNRTTPGITSVSGSGTGDPNELLINNISNPVNATYVYTLIANNCTNPITSSVVVTVNPRAQVNDIPDQAKCVGELTDLVTFNTVNTGGVYTYEWKNGDQTIGLASSGIGSIAPFTTINTGQTLKEAIITVTPYFANEGLTCIGDNKLFSIKAFPAFVVGSVSSDQIICYNSIPAKLIGTPPTGGDLNYTYQWEYSINNGVDWNDVPVNGKAIDYQPSTLIQNTLYRQVQKSASCGSLTTNTVALDVYLATVNIGPNDTICGLVPYVMSQATATLASGYTWTTSGTGTFTGKYLLKSTYYPSTRDMNAGSVILTLSITDDCGNVKSDDMTLTFGQLPAAYFSYSTPTCSKTPVFFTDQSRVSKGYINKWVWDFGDGNTKTIVFPNSPDVLHSFTTPGPSYNVKLTVFTSLGCTAEFTNVVTSLEAPVANFSFPDLLCDNQPVQFTNTSQINGALGMQPWTWDFGDPTTGINNISNLQNPEHQFSASGNFIVKLTVQNSNNCVNTIIDTISVRLRPSVDFTFGKTCLNEQVLFDPDPVKTNFNSISNWLWDFGDGVASDMRNTIHIYNAPGIYTVVLKVTDINGCSNTISHVVLVNPLPSAHFDSSITDCENSTVLFNEHALTSEGYIVKWMWDFGDGTNQVVNYPDNANLTHKYLKPGNYSTTLTVLTSVGCSNSEIQVVTVLPAPVANFSFATSCMNMPVLFTDLSQNNASGDIVKWEWNFGDVESGVNNISTLKDPSHTYVGPGSFNVTLVVTNITGCKNTTTRKVVVNSKPVAKFTSSAISCEGDTVNFTNTSSTPVGTTITSSLWDFGDNISSKEFSPSHKFSTNGTFKVKLIILNSIGCIDTLMQQVTVNPKPIVDFSPSEIRCTGSPVTFTDRSYVPTGFTGSIKTWAWDFGDGTPVVSVDFPSNPNISHTFAGSATSFKVKLTVTATTGCTGFIENLVSLIPSPIANFIYSNALCNNREISFTDLSSENGGGKLQSWSWNFGDPLSGASNTYTQQNATHSFTGAGSYTVSLTVSNPNGCSNTFAQTILVLNSNPLAKFTPSATMCEGEALNFNNGSTTPTGTTITTNLWNFGDNITSLVSSPSHTFATYGIFPVKLVVTNSNGCRDSVLQHITINPKPVVDFSLSEIRCMGSPVSFTDHSFIPVGFAGSIKSWVWDFSDKSVPTTVDYPSNPNVQHTFAGTDTTFMVRLTITSTTGCIAYSEKRVTLIPLPIAKFSFSNNLCNNELVRFTDLSISNGGGDVQSWAWNFGDTRSDAGNTSTQQNPSHVFNGTGTYTVSLTVTNSNGCAVTTIQNVVIEGKPIATFTPSDTRCEGGAVLFTNGSTTSVGTTLTSYNWDFGDKGISGSLSPTHIFATYGSFPVRLDVVNSIGCVSSITQQVVVNPKPVVDFSLSEIRCIGSPVSFTDHSFIPVGFTGSIKTWVWDFGDKTIPVTISSPLSPNMQHTFAGTETSFMVRLTVTSTSGCIAYTEKIITLIPLPIAKFGFSNNLCDSELVRFTDLSTANGGGDVQSWAWNFGDVKSGAGNTSTQQNPSHIFNGTGSYSVSLTVTNSNGCTVNVTQNIVIVGKPVAIFTPSDIHCEGSTILFTNGSTTSVGTILASYNWDFGDKGISGLQSPSHTFATYGSFPVKLDIVNSIGCAASAIQQITVSPKPVVDFSLSEIRCIGSPVSFNDHSFIPVGFTGSIKSWVWDFGDNSVPTTVNYPSTPNVQHTFAGTDTSFVVRLTVTSATGCTSYTEKKIILKPSPAAKFIISNGLCDNRIIRFTDLSGENGGSKIDGWNWNFGDPTSVGNNTSTQQSPFHAFTGPGSYDVSLTVTNINGCTNTVSSTMVIGLHIDAKFTVSTKNCEGEQVTFTDESITPTGTAITSYKWIFGDGQTSTLVSPTHVYKTYGTYTTTLSVVNSSGCTASAIQQVVVTPKPVADFLFSPLRCSGDPVSFTDRSFVTAGFNGYITTWLWDFGDGTTPVTVNYPSKPNIVHTFAEGAPSYKVRLTVTTSNGCSAYNDSVIVVTTAGFIGTYGPYCLSDSPVKLSVEPSGGTFSGPGVQGNYFYPINAGVSNPNSPHTITYSSPTGACPVAPIKIEVVSSPVVKITPQLLGSCNGTSDLTMASVTAGSTAGLYFTYFTDEQAIKPIENPKAVPLGTYYIRGATLSGKCSTIQPVTVYPAEPLQAKFSTIVSPACSGSASGSITIQAVNGSSPFFYQLNSNPAQTSPTFTGLKAGNYSITITDGNSCTVTRDTMLRDNPNAKIVISHKNIACSNDANGSARVDSINGSGKVSLLGSYKYSWNSSPVQATREAVQLGNRYYTVTVTDPKGCGIKDSVFIAVTDTIPPKIVCRTDTVSIILQASVNDPLSNTTKTNEVAVELVKPTVSDNCGIDSLTNDAPAKFRVGVVTPVKWTVTDLVGLTATCTSYVYVKMIPTLPKLLTPNGDGLNDYFEIDGLKDFPKSQLSIFARSGQLVFSSEDYKNEWDCRFTTSKWSNNQFVSPGVYYYVLNLGGTKQKLQGYIYISY
ncbi:MAG: PKD domain-containing protein [Mariniphaga sp.]